MKILPENRPSSKTPSQLSFHNADGVPWRVVELVADYDRRPFHARKLADYPARTPAAEAWGNRGYISYGVTDRGTVAVILRTHQERVEAAIRSGAVQTPNSLAFSPRNGWGEAAWLIRRAVQTGPEATEKPKRALWRIIAWYGIASGFAPSVWPRETPGMGINLVNPVSGFRVDWWADDPYDLRALMEPIAARWRAPRVTDADLCADGVVRPAVVALGFGLRRWAGSPHHRGGDLRAAALVATEDLWRRTGLLIPYESVKRVAASVQDLRASWDDAGRYYGNDDPEVQAARGRQGGIRRRERTADRDRHIRSMRAQGASQRAIGKLVGLSQWGVGKVLRRV